MSFRISPEPPGQREFSQGNATFSFSKQQTWATVATDAHAQDININQVPSFSQRLNYNLQNAIRAAQHHPIPVVIVPVLLFCIITSVGLWAIVTSAKLAEDQRRSTALSIATRVIENIQAEIRDLIQPITIMGLLVEQSPMWSVVNGSIARTIGRSIDLVGQDEEQFTGMMYVAPMGVPFLSYPPTARLGDATGMGLMLAAYTGQNYSQADLDKFQHIYSMMAVPAASVNVVGPFFMEDAGYLPTLLVVYTVHLGEPTAPSGDDDDEDDEENLDLPVPGDVFNLSNCTWMLAQVQQAQDSGICPPPDDTPRHLWGFIQGEIGLEKLLGPLQDLVAQDYHYRLAVGNGQQIASRGAAPQDPVTVSIEMPFYNSSSVRRAATAMNMSDVAYGASYGPWQLSVEPEDGWGMAWRTPVIASTACGAAVIAGLFAAFMIAKKRARWLLESMLPPKVIDSLSNGRRFVEKFPTVTVLFSDVVGYTTMSSRMDSLQVVDMLNQMFKMFDNLARKHSVFKLDIVGDAWICVGGVPEHEDPTAAATRVARVAQEMLQVVNETSFGGNRIKIRIGIHAGPAVAAVIGASAPKMSLFGDTVNVAARCESSGVPMKIHVSQAVADLLQPTGEFTLQHRGEVYLKGRGVMNTYFLHCDVPIHPDGDQSVRLRPGSSAPSTSGAVSALRAAARYINLPQSRRASAAALQHSPTAGGPRLGVVEQALQMISNATSGRLGFGRTTYAGSDPSGRHGRSDASAWPVPASRRATYTGDSSNRPGGRGAAGIGGNARGDGSARPGSRASNTGEAAGIRPGSRGATDINAEAEAGPASGGADAYAAGGAPQQPIDADPTLRPVSRGANNGSNGTLGPAGHASGAISPSRHSGTGHGAVVAAGISLTNGVNGRLSGNNVRFGGGPKWSASGAILGSGWGGGQRMFASGTWETVGAGVAPGAYQTALNALPGSPNGAVQPLLLPLQLQSSQALGLEPAAAAAGAANGLKPVPSGSRLAEMGPAFPLPAGHMPPLQQPQAHDREPRVTFHMSSGQLQQQPQLQAHDWPVLMKRSPGGASGTSSMFSHEGSSFEKISNSNLLTDCEEEDAVQETHEAQAR